MLTKAFLNVAGFLPWITVLILLLLLMRSAKMAVSSRFFRTAWIILALRCALPVSLALPAAPLPTLQIELPAAEYTDTTGANTFTAFITVPVAFEGEAAVSVPQRPEAEPTDSAGHAANHLPEETPVYQYNHFTAYTAMPVSDAAPFTLAQLIDLSALVWAVGMAAFFCWRVGCYLLFMLRLRRQRQACENAGLLCLAKKAFGHPVKLYYTSLLAGPALVGLVSPAVYLTDCTFSADEMQMILAHEACHARQKDIWFKWLLTCACAVCWFDPAVWWMAKAADLDTERACDEFVLKGKDVGFCKAYGATILATLHPGRRSAFSTEFGGGAKSIKARFAAMFDRRKKRGLAPALAILLAAVLLAGSLISCTRAPAASAGTPVNPIVPAMTEEEILQNVTYRIRDRVYPYPTANEATGETINQFTASDNGVNVTVPAPTLPEGWTDTYRINSFQGIFALDTGDWFIAQLLKDKDETRALYLSHSADSGESWVSRFSPLPDLAEGYDLGGYEMLNNSVGYLTLRLADEKMAVLRTEDGGESWQVQFSGSIIPVSETPHAETVREVRFVNETIGFASGNGSYADRPIVMQTTDSGKSWQPCPIAVPNTPSKYRACCIVTNGAAVEVRCFTDTSPTQENVAFTCNDLSNWSFTLRARYISEMEDEEFWSAAVLLGDSLTTGWELYNTGVSADRVLAQQNAAPPDGQLWQNAAKESYDPIETAAAFHPNHLLMQFGANLLADEKNTPDELIALYERSINALRARMPDCTIYLQSVLYATKKGAGAHPGLSADRVRVYNKKLAQLAEKTGCIYLDLNAALSEGEQLKPEYAAADGIHLAAKGYTVWKQAIRTGWQAQSSTDDFSLYQAGQAELTALLKAGVGDPSDTADAPQTFLWPVPGQLLISSAYGWRSLWSNADFHNGIDIAAPVGAKIVAAAEGIVEKTGESTVFGGYVILSHGRDTKTLYARLSNIEVSEGRSVTAGQTLALCGASGILPGSTLHFELLYAGAQVDPSSYFNDLHISGEIGLNSLLFPVGEGFQYMTRGYTGPEEHAGIDLACAYGSPVYAVAEGIVSQAEYGSTEDGAYLVIDHGGTLVTRYTHCSGFAVSAGEAVSAGQLIGYVGSSGNSTGPHLHFELQQNGVPIDPLPYLGGKDASIPKLGEDGNLYFEF